MLYTGYQSSLMQHNSAQIYGYSILYILFYKTHYTTRRVHPCKRRMHDPPPFMRTLHPRPHYHCVVACIIWRSHLNFPHPYAPCASSARSIHPSSSTTIPHHEVTFRTLTRTLLACMVTTSQSTLSVHPTFTHASHPRADRVVHDARVRVVRITFHPRSHTPVCVVCGIYSSSVEVGYTHFATMLCR